MGKAIDFSGQINPDKSDKTENGMTLKQNGLYRKHDRAGRDQVRWIRINLKMNLKRAAIFQPVLD